MIISLNIYNFRSTDIDITSWGDQRFMKVGFCTLFRLHYIHYYNPAFI